MAYSSRGLHNVDEKLNLFQLGVHLLMIYSSCCNFNAVINRITIRQYVGRMSVISI